MTNQDIINDPFSSQDEKDMAAKLIALEQQAHQGALYEDWMRHQAGQSFAKYLEGQITLAKNEWLAAEDRDKAEITRIQAQVYAKIKTWIYAQIQAGKLAATEVKKFADEGERLNGLIKPPTRPE